MTGRTRLTRRGELAVYVGVVLGTVAAGFMLAALAWMTYSGGAR